MVEDIKISAELRWFSGFTFYLSFTTWALNTNMKITINCDPIEYLVLGLSKPDYTSPILF